MRLWHQELLHKLPKQWLQGQHRECCALRGKGWNKKHSTVDYIFKYPKYYLEAYHLKVMDILIKKYNVNIDINKWYDACSNNAFDILIENNTIYSEHNDEYLKECINNLKEKGIIL